IVQALVDGRVLTTSELCARIPDVSKASVYRQVALLTDGGLLEVDSERRVRGAVERPDRLHRARAVLRDEEIPASTLADRRRGFAARVAALLADFNVYLDRARADPRADSVSYRQFSLWLSDDELAGLIDQVGAALRALLGNAPAPGRRRYLLTPIL